MADENEVTNSPANNESPDNKEPVSRVPPESLGSYSEGDTVTYNDREYTVATVNEDGTYSLSPTSGETHGTTVTQDELDLEN